jgi:phosphomevalonate kinase
MTRLSVSAPGKLVLLGEYAVLFGHPAAVLAIDRRARVELSKTTGSSFSISAPGLVDGQARFEIEDNGAVVWRDETGSRLALVETLLGGMLAEGWIRPDRLTRFDAVLDTRSFFDSSVGSESKLGLGSSAALTVALTSALAMWADRGDLLEPRISWLRRLLGLYREFQGGRGSGVDLAASLIGGALEYRLDDSGSVDVATPVVIPEGLHLAFVWTHRSADTGGFLKRLATTMDRDRAPADRAIKHLGSIATNGIAELRAGETDAFLDTVDAYCDGMERLGAVTGIQIVSDVHLELREIAKRHDARYKPSGAGGGDMGMIFAANRRTLEAVSDSIRDGGYDIVDLAVDPDGLSLNS